MIKVNRPSPKFKHREEDCKKKKKIIAITIFSNIIDALAALFFSNHSVEL